MTSNNPRIHQGCSDIDAIAIQVNQDDRTKREIQLLEARWQNFRWADRHGQAAQGQKCATRSQVTCMYRKLTFPGNLPPFPLHKIFVIFLVRWERSVLMLRDFSPYIDVIAIFRIAPHPPTMYIFRCNKVYRDRVTVSISK